MDKESGQTPFPVLFAEPMQVFSSDMTSNGINSMGGTVTNPETGTGGHGDTDTDTDSD